MAFDMQSPWAYIFYVLSSRANFPNDNSSDQWGLFFADALKLPVFLAVIAIIGSIALLVYLLCGDVCGKAKPDGVKPSTSPIINCGVAALVIIWLASFFCLIRFFKGVADLDHTVNTHLLPELTLITSDLQNVNPKVQNAVNWVARDGGFEQSCDGWNDLGTKEIIPKEAREQLDGIESQLKNVSGYVTQVTTMLAPMPPMIKNFRDQFVKYVSNNRILICLGILGTAIFISAFIGWSIRAVSGHGDGPAEMATAESAESSLCICAIPMALAVLLLCSVGIVLMTGGNIIGNYCTGVDDNTVKLVENYDVYSGNGTANLTATVTYYIKGTGEPMIKKIFQQVDTILTPLSENMWMIDPALSTVGVWCERADHGHLPSTIKEVVADLKQIKPLVERENMLNYYNDVIVTGLCGPILTAIAWQMLAMLLAGFCILPCMSAMTHQFLDELVTEYKLQDETRKKMIPSKSTESRASD